MLAGRFTGPSLQAACKVPSAFLAADRSCSPSSLKSRPAPRNSRATAYDLAWFATRPIDEKLLRRRVLRRHRRRTGEQSRCAQTIFCRSGKGLPSGVDRRSRAGKRRCESVLRFSPRMTTRSGSRCSTCSTSKTFARSCTIHGPRRGEKFDSVVLINDRLAPDMLNFTKQIQDRKSRCSSSAGSRLARRAQTELVHLLRQRVARPVQDLRGLIDVAARLLQSGAHVVDARRARAEL